MNRPNSLEPMIDLMSESWGELERETTCATIESPHSDIPEVPQSDCHQRCDSAHREWLHQPFFCPWPRQ